jgi:hypothetical protein
MPNTYRILEAVTDLESREVLNVKATAEKYGLDRTTLGKQWQASSVDMFL